MFYKLKESKWCVDVTLARSSHTRFSGRFLSGQKQMPNIPCHFSPRTHTITRRKTPNQIKINIITHVSLQSVSSLVKCMQVLRLNLHLDPFVLFRGCESPCANISWWELSHPARERKNNYYFRRLMRTESNICVHILSASHFESSALKYQAVQRGAIDCFNVSVCLTATPPRLSANALAVLTASLPSRC